MVRQPHHDPFRHMRSNDCHIPLQLPRSREHRRLFPVARKHFAHYPLHIGGPVLYAFGRKQHVPVYCYRQVKAHDAQQENQEHHIQGLRHRHGSFAGPASTAHPVPRKNFHARSHRAYILRRKLACKGRNTRPALRRLRNGPCCSASPTFTIRSNVSLRGAATHAVSVGK